MSRSFCVELPVYDGPLDLLLELLRDRKLSIDEVSVCLVASQFLTYVEQALDLNLNLSGEWVEMAAKLIFWKSRSLLPSPPPGKRNRGRDREYGRFIDLLKEYARAAAAALAQSKAEEDARLSHAEPGASEDAGEDSEEEEEPAFTLWDLIRLCERHARESYKPPAEPPHPVEPDLWTVEEAMIWVAGRVAEAPEPLTVELLFRQRPDLPQKIATFLGSLELAKAHAIELDQAAEPFLPIVLRRKGLNVNAAVS